MRVVATEQYGDIRVTYFLLAERWWSACLGILHGGLHAEEDACLLHFI